MASPRKDFSIIADALVADDPNTITDSTGIAFRRFADHTGSDRHALSACIRPSRVTITEDMIRGITTPVLVAVGDEDEIGGSAPDLAAMMPNAESVTLEGYDHMRSTGCEPFKKSVLSFFGG